MFRRSTFFLASLCAICARAASVQIDGFDEGAKAAQVWRAVDKTPAVNAPGAKGVMFPCPFDRGDDRFYWDRDVRLDLSGYTSLAADLSCDDPAALRAFGLYLRSGNGWYVWAHPLREGGRQTLVMRKAEFSTEGSPAGWNKIDRVRISPWRGAAKSISLTMFFLTARRDARIVIKSTTSSANAADRAYAGKITDRVSRMLADAGVAHTVVTEEEAPAALAGATLAILPCNQEPPAAVISAMKKMIAGGGKAIVFFGGSPALADLMGVKLGDFEHVDDLSRWRSFAFAEPHKWHVPQEIFQQSMSLHPAWPANDRGKVIAWWRDASGKSQKEPAWIATEHGFWMTHVMLDDDIANKERMLVGLAGSLDPGVWADAARDALTSAGKIDSYRDFNHAATALEAAGGNPGIASHIAAARAQYGRMFSLYNSGDHRGALDASEIVDSQMVEAYAMSQSPRAGEFRGVWDHEGTGLYPGNWDATCDLLARNGMNAVFANLLWGGNAHFPCESVPTSITMRMYGDQAALLTRAAKKTGLQTHLWVVCFNLGHAPDEFIRQLQKEGRTQVGADGKPTVWLNPAHPKNQAMLLGAMSEAVRSYPFDGVHLDYIRYPGADFDFSPTTRQMFETSLGEKISRWPADVRNGGKFRAKFVSWRATQITAFVRRTHDTLKAINPNLKISAAVWGGWPDTISSIAQDWAAWIKNGYVDFVCPMDYSDSLYQFNSLVTKQLALPNATGRIFPGIGVTADESQLRPDQVIEQIATARRLGAAGFVLFDLKHTLQRETLPALSRGTTAR
jgi:uncharacterized lipoprotein YddW (UPF0748 family)